MRKKQLEALEIPRPTEEMYERVKTDRYIRRNLTGHYAEKTFGTRMYYAAREEDGILIVSAWSRATLEHEKEEPNFTTYIDPDGLQWISLTCEGRWSEAKLYTIDNWYGVFRTSRYAENVSDPKGLEICNRVLGTQRESIDLAVRDWQDGICEKRSKAKAEKKKALWDRRMAMVPKAPEDFENWADKEGLGEDHFLFFRRKNRRDSTQVVYCTRCGNTAEGDFDLKHSPGIPLEWYYHSKAKYFNCPCCGYRLSTKSWNKNSSLRTYGYVVLPQTTEGGEIVLRQYRIDKFFRHEKNGLLKDRWEYELVIDERRRVFVDPLTFESTESYEQRNTEHFGVIWAQTSRWIGGHQMPEDGFTGEMYTHNADEIGKASSLPRSVICECASDAGKWRSPQLKLKRACRNRCTEYLIKTGLTRLAKQILEGAWSSEMRTDAKDLKTLLDLDGQQLRTMKDINGSICTLENLHAIRSMNERADFETLRYMEVENIYVKQLPLKKTGMNLQRTMNYLRKQRPGWNTFREALETYKDYLNMAETRGMDLHDEIVCRTPRLRELHDRYADEAASQKDKSRDQQVDKIFRNIREDHEKNEKHFKYSRQGLVIIVPKKASDITKEGRRQHHCVGATDTYILRMNRRETFILFLRKEDAQQNAYYTLEVKYDGRILQSYGAYDRRPDAETVDEFLEHFTHEIQKRTKKEQKDMQKQAGQETLAAAM